MEDTKHRDQNDHSQACSLQSLHTFIVTFLHMADTEPSSSVIQTHAPKPPLTSKHHSLEDHPRCRDRNTRVTLSTSLRGWKADRHFCACKNEWPPAPSDISWNSPSAEGELSKLWVREPSLLLKGETFQNGEDECRH